MQAVCDGREDLLDYLLTHCTEDQINSLDKQGFAALHYAVKYESVSMIKKLIAKCGKCTSWSKHFGGCFEQCSMPFSYIFSLILLGRNIISYMQLSTGVFLRTLCRPQIGVWQCIELMKRVWLWNRMKCRVMGTWIPYIRIVYIWYK